jgi:hypothetical protein
MNTKTRTVWKIAKNISRKYVHFYIGLPFLTAAYSDLLQGSLIFYYSNTIKVAKLLIYSTVKGVI